MKRQIIRDDISRSTATAPLEVVTGKDPFKAAEDANFREQLKVEDYNRNIGAIHSSFQDKELIGSRIVVRLFKYDYINPPLSELLKVTTRKDMKIKIPNRSQTGYTTINNPLPYMYQGIVCQVPEDEFFKKAFPSLSPGSVVETGFFQIANSIYYPNKETLDPVVSDQEIADGANPVPNFQGYVILSPSDITHVNKAKVAITYVTPEDEVKAKDALRKAIEEFKNRQDGKPE